MPWALLTWIMLLSALFAQAEIQIEGPHGWATALPTWRLTAVPSLQFLFGGREITGYHAFMFTFMLAAFHLPLAINGQFSLQIEARILGSLMLFWILEDVLWFVMNPAYGLARLTPQAAPWHPHWALGVPVDYLVLPVIAAALIALSYRQPRSAGRTEKESE
jgi:hypothetical protein